ncbi:MAG: DUF3090 family protein [Anaerolineae bacterium]|nr:DUF3090 family protein [Anaerolineae bacterium]
MPNLELELRPVDFLTVGTVGPRGNRVFYLQGAQGPQLISLVIEKFQAGAMAEAIIELLDDLKDRHPLVGDNPPVNLDDWRMDLRDPIEPSFRVGQIGLGYDEASDLLVLVVQELVSEEEAAMVEQPSLVRFWGNRATMQALALRIDRVVSSGRPDPKQNGRIHYYWT